MKKQSNLSRLLTIAGSYRYLTYASWILSAISALIALVPYYFIWQVMREVLEPRLMGKEMGLKPLYVLLSVYVGLKLFGVGGIVLGPIGLTILKTVFEQASFSHTT